MLNGLITRWGHARTIGKTWWFLLAAGWGLFWALDASIEKWDLLGTKMWWDAHTTQLPSHWQTWLVVLLVIMLLALVEGSYRHHKTYAENEQSKLRKEKAKNEIAPDIEVQVTSLITKGKLSTGVSDLFVHVILTLKAPSEVVIRDFSLTAQQGTEYMHTVAVDDTAQWEVVKENPEGAYLHMPCTPLAKELKQRGDPVEGWIHFRLNDVKESWLLKSMLWVKVNSAHGTCLKELQGSHAFPDRKTKGVMSKVGAY